MAKRCEFCDQPMTQAEIDDRTIDAVNCSRDACTEVARLAIELESAAWKHQSACDSLDDDRAAAFASEEIALDRELQRRAKRHDLHGRYFDA